MSSSEKNLTDAEWKKFSKGRKFEDRDWLKALDALELGAKARDAMAQLKALDDVEKQANKLRAANKADKELSRYLDDAEKELTSQRKLLEAEARKDAQQAEQSEGEDEEGPAALSTKMLPVLRAVPKGEDVVMQALIAVAGKDVAVLVSRRAIGASMKKLLIEELGVAGGAKYMAGECIWEANAHTFVLEAKVANLAKLIKAALFKQTGAKFKVRVRGSDPHDVDEDGDAGEEIESAEGEGEASPEKALYESRMAELKPKISTALRDLIGDVPKIKALTAFAEAKAAEDNHKAALQALDTLAKLLPGAAPASSSGADDEAHHLTAELAKLAPMVQQAIAAHPERRQELLAAVAAFQAHLKDHQFPQAKDALMQIGRLLVALKHEAGATATSTSTSTTTTPTKAGKIPVHALMPIWNAATEAVMDQTTALIVALRKFDDAELNRMAEDLLQTVNVLLAEVDDALEEYDQMTGEERAANADEALGFLRAQQREVASETLIKAADSNPLGIKSQLGDTMSRALDEIAAAFEA